MIPLMKYMEKQREFISSVPEQPEAITQITQLSFVARYIERVAIILQILLKMSFI